MILLSALLVMGGPIKIAILGSEAGAAGAQLASLLGPGYTVQSFKESTDLKPFQPSFIVVEPSAIPRGSSYDRYVPELRTALAKFTSLPMHPRVVLCLSGAQDEANQVFVRPLSAQAAREAGVSVLDATDATALAQSLYSLVVDRKAGKQGWQLVSFDSEQSDEGPAMAAIDGDPETYWHTEYSPKLANYPHQLTIDMQSVKQIGGFRYLPRQDGGVNGRVKAYEFLVSTDGKTWSGPVASGTFPDVIDATVVRLKSPIGARFFRFRALSEQTGQAYASAAELDALPAKFAISETQH